MNDSAKEPFAQVNIDSFSLSIRSIEGCNHVVVWIQRAEQYEAQELYVKVIKKWYSYTTAQAEAQLSSSDVK